jgi:L-lactate dehydrogenase complex protein LldG
MMRSDIEPTQALLQDFQAAAENVSAAVSRVQSMEEAISYTMDLCESKEACQLLVSGCERQLSNPAEKLCDRQQSKVLAAPLIPEEDTHFMGTLCAQSRVRLVREGLRDHLAGIDMGFTIADFGIAETGTLVIDSSSEDVRLATMVSEVHVVVLPASRIRETSHDLEEELRDRFGTTPNYYAFITGASRTADIERVLALGVHGPLELHILVLEDD